MPRRLVSGAATAHEGLAGSVLPTWQATGLSLAVIVRDVLNGSGVLAFGVIAVGLIWTLHRLHAHAPRSKSTADLIASVPGAAPARIVGLVQYAAYVLMGAYTAKSIGLLALSWTTDPIATAAGWWWPATSVAAAVVAAVLVAAVPTRRLAPVVTALAGFGLLVFFYVALAVLARVASGTAPIVMPVQVGTTAAPSEWGPAVLVISLAVAVPGFEIPTAANDRLRSVARPLGWTLAFVVVCAATAWAAVNLATAGDFHYDAADLIVIASEMFGESASLWLLAASGATATAIMLVLLWGATRVVHDRIGRGGLVSAVTATAIALLAVVMCRGWGEVPAKLWGVAGILLIVVYLAAAHANSRLDQDNTAAWGVFVLIGLALAAAVVAVLSGEGAGGGLWPVAIAAAIVGGAVAISRVNTRGVPG